MNNLINNVKNSLEELVLEEAERLKVKNKELEVRIKELEILKDQRSELASIHIQREQDLELQLRQAKHELEEQKSLIPWIGELAQARVRVKELGEGIDYTIQVLEGKYVFSADEIITRLRKLVEKEG